MNTHKDKGEIRPICSYCKKPMKKGFLGLYVCLCRTDFSKLEVSGGSGGSNNMTTSSKTNKTTLKKGEKEK